MPHAGTWSLGSDCNQTCRPANAMPPPANTSTSPA